MDAISAFWNSAVGINLQSFFKIISITSFSKSAVRLNSPFNLNAVNNASYILICILSASNTYWYLAHNTEALVPLDTTIDMYIPFSSSGNGSGTATLNIQFSNTIVCKYTSTATISNGSMSISGCVIHMANE